MTKEQNYWARVCGRRLSRRQALRLTARAGLGVAGVALLGCATAQAPTSTPPRAPAATPTSRPQPSPTPTLKVPESAAFAYSLDLNSLDTHIDSTRQGTAVHDLTYDGLFRRSRDPGLELIPGLALSHQWIQGKVWEVKLRSGVKFHNGEEFDAETVKFNVERQQNVDFKPRYISDFKDIEGVEVVDKYTVRIHPKAPDPTMPLKFVQSMIVPRKYVQEKGNEIMTTEPVGTGPYKFIKWVKDEYIDLELNPDWWGWKAGGIRAGKPQIKKLRFRPIPAESSRIAMLKTGGVDIIHPISADSLPTLKDVSGSQVLLMKSGFSAWIAISLFEEGSPLRDKRVRQAMNYAVDVDTIIKTLLGGWMSRTYSVVGSAYNGYDPNEKPYPFDPKKAKDLLAAAGYPNGFEVEFHNPDFGHTKQKDFVQAIASYLAEVGIKTKIIPYSGTALFPQPQFTAKKGPTGIFYDSRGTSTLDSDFVLYQNIHPAGPRSWTYYRSAEVEKLLEDARTTLDQEARVRMYRQALKIIKEDAPMIFLWEEPYSFVVNRNTLPAANPRLWLVSLWDYGPA
ncbi:MAG: hypothetical protein HYU86_08205 [Chloroflexi bacterium]|nr:hypothetical protein [Chloroflexota bacterium]